MRVISWAHIGVANLGLTFALTRHRQQQKVAILLNLLVLLLMLLTMTLKQEK